MERRVGLKDVAAAAGVAPSTASQVLNNVPGKRISTQTQARVRAAAERLSYTPHALARGLRLQRSQTLALVTDYVGSAEHAGEILRGAQEAAFEAGWLLLLVTTLGNPAAELREVRALSQQHVDGYLYAAMYHREVVIPAGLAGQPIVLVNATSGDPAISSVVPDEASSAYLGVQELTKLGHRRIGFVVEDSAIAAVAGRLAGYRSALADAGLPFDDRLVRPALLSPEEQRAAAQSLLELSDPPTAIFCFTDQVALGLYQTAARLGVRIPERLSVVGFDNQRIIAENLSPVLTTVAIPHYEMGRWGVNQLIAEIGNQPPRPTQILMTGHLVKRDSTAAPKAFDRIAAGPSGRTDSAAVPGSAQRTPHS